MVSCAQYRCDVPNEYFVLEPGVVAWLAVRGPTMWLAGLLLATACSSPNAVPATSPTLSSPAPSVVAAVPDPDLAADIPDIVGGEPFDVETHRGENALRAMGVNERFLEAFDADLGDVSVALGHRPMATEASTHLSAYAYRVAGASEEALTEYFIPIIEGQTEDAEFEPGRVGGKDVWKPVGPGEAVSGNLLYVHGDTAYLLYGNEPAVVELLLDALP